MCIGLERGKVSLHKYSAKWSKLFQKEKSYIVKTIRNYIVGVYHVGSTAVPNISSKPIIDILVVIQANKEEQVNKILKEKYKKSEFEPRGHPLFKKEIDEISTHYLHIVEVMKDWQRYIIFRDYLINHPNKAQKYEELKKEAAKEYSDERIKYTEMKKDFIHKTIKKIRGKLNNSEK